MDEPTEAQVGREIVASGGLMPWRLKLGLSRSAMSDFIGINLITYRKWETNPQTKMWTTNAARLGRFVRSAERQLAVLSEGGVKLSELTPFHEVASMRGLTQEGLLHQYRAGDVEGVDLGVLGLWM